MPHVWMRHNVHGGLAQLPADAGWEELGWAEVDPPSDDELTAMDAGTTEFDPASHTVAEVQAYLAGAGDSERDRVIAAERGGKNRATITGD